MICVIFKLYCSRFNTCILAKLISPNNPSYFSSQLLLFFFSDNGLMDFGRDMESITRDEKVWKTLTSKPQGNVAFVKKSMKTSKANKKLYMKSNYSSSSSTRQNMNSLWWKTKEELLMGTWFNVSLNRSGHARVINNRVNNATQTDPAVTDQPKPLVDKGHATNQIMSAYACISSVKTSRKAIKTVCKDLYNLVLNN